MQRKLAIQSKLTSVVNQGLLLGCGATGSIDGEEYLYTAGHRDIARTSPFTDDTIFRLASDSKLIGTVAFLKLVEKGEITALEPIKRWIPEFENTKVINPVVDPKIVVLSNPLKLSKNSATIQVTHNKHGLSTGDFVGIQGSSAVDVIPETEINKIHTVTVINNNKYTITVSTQASSNVNNAGGAVTVYSLPSGAKSTTYQGVIYYYTEDDLKRDILVNHVLTHTLGYLYNVIILNTSFGYVDGLNDPLHVLKSNIQAGIMQNMLFPTVIPVVLQDVMPLYTNIQDWVSKLATVPLLFQPGEDWSYGPTLSILGALIEKIDGRSLEQYMADEITTPLGMVDTGFFTDDVEKISRVMDVHIPYGGFLINAAAIIPGVADFFYNPIWPKIAFIDGGMFSTLKDRAIFYRMLKNDGVHNDEPFLSSALVSLLSHNRIGDLIQRPRSPPLNNMKWGLGVGVTQGSDFDITLAGQTTRAITWAGAFNSAFLVDFGNDSYFNFGTNIVDAVNGPYIYTLLMNLHMAALPKVKALEDPSNLGPSVKIFQ